jgi:acetyl-CoA carboxylase carboxyl transferase subunit alpha
MDLNFLDFEQPIAELEAKIDELRFVGDDSEINISDEIARLKSKSEALTRSIFSSLTAWQVAQLARHPLRPYTLDYLAVISPDFQELHGDRMFADDPALVGGVGRLDGKPVVLMGAQKGPVTNERVRPSYRYTGRLPRHRCRGARPERSHCPEPLRDGASQDTNHQHRDWRGRVRRGAGHRGR